MREAVEQEVHKSEVQDERITISLKPLKEGKYGLIYLGNHQENKVIFGTKKFFS
jgi:hypothetical protein